MSDFSMLQALRVLDFTRVLAGPLCTMMLGDLGADVIKVERIDGGDESRGWGPPFDDRGESAYFLSVNRNKKSLAIDLDSESDRRLIAQLIAGADVVVDNFRPGTLERRALAPETFLGPRPGLLWCTVTAFGPQSDRPGYDFVLQAERGWMAITGERLREPVKVGVAVVDVLAAKDAAVTILAALVRRDRTGRGGRLFVSLSQSAAAGLVNVAQNVLVTGQEAERWGNAHANLVPYQLFDAADRSIVVAVGSDAQWHACARALGLAQLADDDRLASNAGRLAHRAQLTAAIADRIRQRTASEWVSALATAGVPCGLVKGVREVLAEIDASPLTGVAPSVPGGIRFPPPRLDEHGDEIRRRGWDIFDL